MAIPGADPDGPDRGLASFACPSCVDVPSRGWPRAFVAECGVWRVTYFRGESKPARQTANELTVLWHGALRDLCLFLDLAGV